MSQSPRTILLLDADSARAIDTAQILLQHSVSVLMANDVATAQQLVRHHRPGVVVLDGGFLSIKDLREKLFIHGLNVDTPFVILSPDREPLAETNVPYAIISRPLTDAGITSLLAIQGLPVQGEIPPIVTPSQTQPSLL
ncbi:MAG: hypothetical protein HQ472_05120 [Ignavibacteria bacterium]|nr:hypothetical protein [Ignavibacteria bacterium]